MNKYDSKKINPDFTNLDYAKQFFKKAQFLDDLYDLKNGYTIQWIENEDFCVDFTYYDRDVGYVTDSDLFLGDFGQCIEFIKKQVNRGIYE